MEKTYTVGEVVRLGLLKNHHGLPYRHTPTILKLLAKRKIKRVKTPFGMGYSITKEDIKALNARWAK